MKTKQTRNSLSIRLHHIVIGILFLSLYSMNLSASEGKEILQKVRANYTGIESFEMELTYSLYKGYNGKTPVESYVSAYNKSKGSYYRNVLKNEFINHPDYSIIVDHNNRQVILGKPSMENNPVIEFDKILKYCGKITSKKLIEDLTELTVEINNNNDIPFSKVVYKIDKDHWIQEVAMYYVNETNFSGSYFKMEMDFPKLVVQYKVLNNKWKDKKGLTSMNTYALKNDKNEWVLDSRYSSYTLVDNRKK